MAALLKFAAKCGIAGGVVYGVTSQDIFSSQDRAISSYRRLESKTLQNVPGNVPELPSSVIVRQRWNSGVQSVFSSLSKAPDAAMDVAHSAVDKTKEFVQNQLKS